METAVAAIELAEIGFSIAKILHQYAKGVNSSQKQIRSVGNEVENTSKVLKQVNLQLDIGQQGKLYSEEGRATAYSALEGCRQTFNDLRLFLNGVVRYKADGKVSVKTMAKWPLRSSELEQSRKDLERWKSTLQLSLMVVLLKQSTTNSDAAVAGMLRLQIGDLVNRTKVNGKEQLDKEPPVGVDHALPANKHESFNIREQSLTTTGVQLLAMSTMRGPDASRQTSPDSIPGADGLDTPDTLMSRSMHEVSKAEIHASDPDPFAGIGCPPKSSLSKFQQAIISDIVLALDQYPQSAAELASAITEENGQWKTRKTIDLSNTDALLQLVCLRSDSLRTSYKRYLPAKQKKGNRDARYVSTSPRRTSIESATMSDDDGTPDIGSKKAKEVLGLGYLEEDQKGLPPLVIKTEKVNVRFGAEDVADEALSRLQSRDSEEDPWDSESGSWIQRRRPSPHHMHTTDREGFLMSGVAGGGLHRSRSTAHASAPRINVYNRIEQDGSPMPNSYAPYPVPPPSGSRRASPRASPEGRGRGRSRKFLQGYISPVQESEELRSLLAATENRSWLSHEAPTQEPKFPPPKEEKRNKKGPYQSWASNVASGSRHHNGNTFSMADHSAVPTEQQATGEEVVFEQDPVDELLQRWTV